MCATTTITLKHKIAKSVAEVTQWWKTRLSTQGKLHVLTSTPYNLIPHTRTHKHATATHTLPWRRHAFFLSGGHVKTQLRQRHKQKDRTFPRGALRTEQRLCKLKKNITSGSHEYFLHLFIFIYLDRVLPTAHNLGGNMESHFLRILYNRQIHWFI